MSGLGPDLMAAKRLSALQRQDLLKRYRGRAAHAKKRRDADGVDAVWKKCIELYRGKHFSGGLSSEDRIAVNICFATINVIEPSVAVNHPKLVVWARKPEDESKGAILETVLNYWWRHFKVQSEVRLAVKDWLVIGHGWLKVGWRYVEEPKAAEDRELTEAKNLEEGDQSFVPDDPSEPTANDPDSEESSGDVYEVTEDRPFVERVSPFDVFVDPEAKTLASAKWIAQRLVKPIEEVRQDKRYRRASRMALRPDSEVKSEGLNATGDDYPDDDIQRITIYEFYDLQMGTMCVFAKGLQDQMLLDPIPQPYAFGHPFVMLRNYDVPDEFYPMGDIEALEPLQMELDKTRSQMMNHRKRFNRKFLYDPTAFDPTGMSALNNDADNVLVPVADSNRPLNEILVPIPQTAVEPQLYQYADSTLEMMDRVSGASEYQQGALPEIRRTATEASMIQDAATARASDKLARLELVIAEVADRVVQLAQQYLTEDQTARVVGKNGFPIWVPYGREDIQGEFDFEVEAGSTQPKNDSFRRNQALQLLQALTPWAQAGLVNAQVLLSYALRYGFEVKNPDEFMAQQQPQPEQGEQQKSPRQSLIESLNYKDAPPDIQRQIEAAAGFQPSQVGGSSPAEGHLAKAMPQFRGQDQQGQAASGQVQAQLANLAHQAQQAQLDRQHEVGMAQQQHQQGMTSSVQQAELEALLAQQAINARHQLQVQNTDKALGFTE